jgi:hypothetical protein
MTIEEAAARSVEDSYFAQRVISGEEDYPEVRDAILADLFESTTAVGGRSEAEAFELFDAKFQDLRPVAGPMGPCFVKYYPKGPRPETWDEWLEMAKPNLNALTRAEL